MEHINKEELFASLKFQMVKYTATTQKVKHYPHSSGKEYDTTTAWDYVMMCRNPTKEIFYAQWYNDEDLVKPFFDFDLEVKIGTKRWCNKQKKKHKV